MKITLKLFSELSEYLPPEADGNALEIDASGAVTADSLIEKYGLPRAEVQVVMRNGEYLPPEQRDTPLQDGDVISIWPSIQGG